jgi:type IV secretion system protein VirD4
MKKIIKTKFFSIPFLFCLTFVVLYIMITMVMKELHYSDWKITAEASAIFSLLMVATQFRGKKKREYEDIENGSSIWGKAKDIKPYIDKIFSNNIIFSATEFLSMDMRKTRRDCHVFVVGGSGSGKSRYYAKPNIMQMNASYVITDPSGEHLRDEGKMLKEHGYKVKVFNVVKMENSMHFNPFVYFKETEDILRFINIFIANTNGGNQNANKDDFWSNAEKLWFMAHISYVQETCQDYEKSMNSVVMLLNNSEARDDDETFKSAVDVLFDELEEKNPESFAVKQYKKYKLAAGKTAKSILISVGVRLASFDIPKLSSLVDDDELELDKMGDENTALFIIVNAKDPTYNFLVAILLDVMFNTLSGIADELPDSHLRIPVRCILDEIANIGFFPNLHILVTVLRKNWISLEFLFQNINQVKALYKDNWATIEGNCDTTVFLGGKGEDTTKYVSNDLLGKATIDTVSYGGGGTASSLGQNSYNSNEQKAGRNLKDETEVSRLKDDECIVSIRGLNPFNSKKYKTEEHPNYRYLADSNPANTYSYRRGMNLANKSIQYVTIDLQEDL